MMVGVFREENESLDVINLGGILREGTLTFNFCYT